MTEEFFEVDTYSSIVMCAEPTFLEGLKFAKDLIIANVLLRILVQYLSQKNYVNHSLSVAIGSFLLYDNIGMAFFWTATLAIGSYLVLLGSSVLIKEKRGLATAALVITFLLTSEILVIDPVMWQKIRGIQMVVAMKIISISVDYDRNLFKHLPNPIEFFGYVFCPANCILGPWISYQNYCDSMSVKYISRNWFKLIFVQLCYSILLLLLSNCVVPWYIQDDSHKWLLAYRDAQAFRTSHYFVSIMSHVSMLAAGFGLTNDCQQEIEVTKPLFIEMPRSLVQVVVYWNMPMHKWLKNYVFKVTQPYGQFIAISMTYIVSSLLHGLNFQLSAVLLSIGLFSYVEYKVRAKIASIFSMCCLVNLCSKNCNHLNKAHSLSTRITNLFFSLITIIDLAYLGVMFEASFSLQESGYSYRHTLQKWENLNFACHIIKGILYFLYLII